MVRKAASHGGCSCLHCTVTRFIVFFQVFLLFSCALLLFVATTAGDTAGGAVAPWRRAPWPPSLSNDGHLVETAAGFAHDATTAHSDAFRCRVPPGRHLAVFQPAPWHSELFGTLVAYAAACGHRLILHYNLTDDKLSALPYYERLYGMSVQLASVDSFLGSHTGYDAVFFTTPHLPCGLGTDGHWANAHRFIYFMHVTSDPAYAPAYARIRLHMSPLVGGPPWALPVYPPPELLWSTGTAKAAGMATVPPVVAPSGLPPTSDMATGARTSSITGHVNHYFYNSPAPGTSREANETTATSSSPPAPLEAQARLNRKTLVMVGSLSFDNDNYNASSIFSLADGLAADGWAVRVYGRDWIPPPSLRVPANVHVAVKPSTDDVIAAVQQATFVLIFPSVTSWYVTDRLTGALPLAISQGTPILTTEPFAGVYSVGRAQGVIGADSADHAVQQLTDLNLNGYTKLVQAMHAFRLRAWVHAVRAFEDLLLAIPVVADAQARTTAGTAEADGKAGTSEAGTSTGHDRDGSHTALATILTPLYGSGSLPHRTPKRNAASPWHVLLEYTVDIGRANLAQLEKEISGASSLASATVPAAQSARDVLARIEPVLPLPLTFLRPLTAEGSAESNKRLFGHALLVDRGTSCVVYQVDLHYGSEFIGRLASTTSCVVHVFPCGTPLHEHPQLQGLIQKGRVHLHRWCVGQPVDTAAVLSTGVPVGPWMVDVDRIGGHGRGFTLSLWETQRRLGHKHIDVLCLSLGGLEWAFLDSQVLHSESGKWPDQIVVDLDLDISGADYTLPVTKTPSEVITLFTGLTELRYCVVANEPHPADASKVAVTLVRSYGA